MSERPTVAPWRSLRLTLTLVLGLALMARRDLAISVEALVGFAAIAAMMCFTGRIDGNGAAAPLAVSASAPKEVV